MNLVLDTNVVVAAGFSRESDAAAIVRAVRANRLTLIWDAETRRETRRIVERIPPLDWDDFADLYNRANRYIGDLPLERCTIVDGPLDRHFAALADAAGAPLVTNDSDLLDVRDRLAPAVATPAEFARRHL